MSRSPGNTAKYFRRLGVYVWAERRLMAFSTTFGVMGLCLPFVYPRLIGLVIDSVIVGKTRSGVLLTNPERGHELLIISIFAGLTALAWSVVGYAKGHFTLQWGDGVVKFRKVAVKVL